MHPFNRVNDLNKKMLTWTFLSYDSAVPWLLYGLAIMSPAHDQNLGNTGKLKDVKGLV